jgi:site-specific recombinase XerD
MIPALHGGGSVMLELYYQYRKVISRFRSGALGDEIDRIASNLSQMGYKHESVKIYLSRVACFSAYASRCGCSKSKPIAARIVDRFVRARHTIAARLSALVAIHHAARMFPERFSPSPSDQRDRNKPLLTAYLQHLCEVRGLRPKTCEGLLLAAHRMLAWHQDHLRGRPLSAITAKNVLTMTHDLLSACGSDSSRSSMTAYMRSFLRYLHWSDLNAHDLAPFVPKTPCYRLAHLPPRVAWTDVRRAIDAIETTTPSGLRDHAMLLLLATTGLRNRELRELELADIHWRAGEVLVRHAKGHRDRLVPLLAETGAALTRYLLHGRPKTQERTVFLCHQPPVRAFGCSGAVSRIVSVRLQRGGVAIQRGGAHLLRHSLASQMVAQRRPIKEVADLLGHRNIDATAVYIKVALPQLADVALAFPGSAP